MSVLRSLTLGALGAAIFAASAGAETFNKYGAVEGWNVFVDVEKQACLIEAVDPLENVVQIGLTNDKEAAYVGAFTKAETDIKAGNVEDVVLDIDGKLYVGEAKELRGNITKGYSGGYVRSDDPQFIEDIAKSRFMTVFPEKDFAFSVNLAGTFKAIEMAKKCQSELTE